MKTSSKIALGMIATLGIAASTAVLAHGYGYGYGQMMGQGPGGFGPGQCQNAGPGARLDSLKTELKITTQQEPAWQAFEQSVRTQMSAHFAGRAAMAQGPANMQTHIAFMEQRLAGMQAIQKARADLYQVLTPEQKAIFDQYGPLGWHRG